MSSVERGQMSSVETGQMSAVETGQMSAAETGQMSAVETRQMYSIETGLPPKTNFASHRRKELSDSKSRVQNGRRLVVPDASNLIAESCPADSLQGSFCLLQGVSVCQK